MVFLEVLILILIILYLVYLIYKFTEIEIEYEEEPLKEEGHFQKENKEVRDLTSIIEIDLSTETNIEPLYELQTHKVKYWLYDSSVLRYSLEKLYKEVAHKNLWINEPFHSKFYELLLLLSRNEFMIIDKNSKVITMNVRDENNKIKVSNAYQVFSTNEIIQYIINKCIKKIKTFNEKDANNIILSTIIMVLSKSVYCLSYDLSKGIVNNIIDTYEFSKDIEYLLKLLEDKDSRLFFILEAFDEAFIFIDTYPYNDIEIKQQFQESQLFQELPKKFFLEI